MEAKRCLRLPTDILHRTLRYPTRQCVFQNANIEDVEQVGLQLQFHLEFMVDMYRTT